VFRSMEHSVSPRQHYASSRNRGCSVPAGQPHYTTLKTMPGLADGNEVRDRRRTRYLSGTASLSAMHGSVHRRGMLEDRVWNQEISRGGIVKATATWLLENMLSWSRQFLCSRLHQCSSPAYCSLQLKVESMHSASHVEDVFQRLNMTSRLIPRLVCTL